MYLLYMQQLTAQAVLWFPLGGNLRRGGRDPLLRAVIPPKSNDALLHSMLCMLLLVTCYAMLLASQQYTCIHVYTSCQCTEIHTYMYASMYTLACQYTYYLPVVCILAISTSNRYILHVMLYLLPTYQRYYMLSTPAPTALPTGVGTCVPIIPGPPFSP